MTEFPFEGLSQMSEAQRDNLEAGRIAPMGVGIYRCGYNASPNDPCDNDVAWIAPVEEWWAAECQTCLRPAALVEVLDVVRRSAEPSPIR